jgi:hypothetical protein
MLVVAASSHPRLATQNTLQNAPREQPSMLVYIGSHNSYGSFLAHTHELDKLLLFPYILITMPSSRISNGLSKTRHLRLPISAQIMTSYKVFAPFILNFPLIPDSLMSKATKTNNTPLPISLRRHKSIYWLINMQVPFIKNKQTALAYSQHGSQALGLLCIVVPTPSLKISLHISVQLYTPLKCKNI